MLAPREIATILAALQFWREEMYPHDPRVMRPYLKTVGMERFAALTVEEVEALQARLKAIADSLPE